MSKNKIEDIYNFLKLSDKIATSGQPTQEQFQAIKGAGYQVIVNLALPESPNALKDEKQIVESQCMQYIHIPVVWENPTIENVRDFFASWKETQTNKFLSIALQICAFQHLYIFIVVFMKVLVMKMLKRTCRKFGFLMKYGRILLNR